MGQARRRRDALRAAHEAVEAEWAARAIGTGIKVEATHRYHREIPEPRPGEHLWTVLGVWSVADPSAFMGGTFNLDVENLLSIEGPGCFVCEQPWSAEVADRRCPGHPTN